MWPLLIGAGLAAGLAIYEINEDKKAREETEKRRSQAYEFTDGFTKEEFEETVFEAARSIKRIKRIEVEWPDIVCVVRSNSGITDWSFNLDFNDYGSFTGQYWLNTENNESQIPSTLVARIVDRLNDIIMQKNSGEYKDEYYCTNCGAILNDQKGFDPENNTWICKKCGQQLIGDSLNSDVFGDVVWYCDECGTVLNNQNGFTETDGSWTCSKCGFVNDVTESNIRENTFA